MDATQWVIMAGWTLIVAGLAYWMGRIRGEKDAADSDWDDAYRDGRADALAEVHERYSLRAQRAARTQKAQAGHAITTNRIDSKFSPATTADPLAP